MLKGLVMHWTANNKAGANAKANRNYFNTTSTAASAHYIIDDNNIIQCIPDNEIAYHVGAKKYTPFGQQFKPTPNFHFVGVEMCVNEDGNWGKTYRNSVEFAAYFLKMHKLTINNLYRHYDITGKNCPAMMVDEQAWNKFKSDVQKELEGKEVFNIMKYDLKPIAMGMLINTSTLECCSKPSNTARTGIFLRKGIHEPINIYAIVQNEGINWYLVNAKNEQWVAAHYVQIIK